MHQATASLAPASICDDSLLVFWGPRFPALFFPHCARRSCGLVEPGKAQENAGKLCTAHSQEVKPLLDVVRGLLVLEPDKTQ